MRIGILGPLEVEVDGGTVEIGGQRLRALLIRLALDAGRPVGVSALVEALWDGAPPADEVNALQSLVSRLRRALPDPTVIDSGAMGYRLRVADDDVDAVRFEQLASRGRRALEAGRVTEAAELLAAALALWRGPALLDVTDAAYAAGWSARLEELRLAAVEERIEADLRLGRHSQVVPELEALTAEHPLRERPRAQLVRALHGAGRRAEALAAYHATRRMLADDLGVDPSAELQAAHLAVLRDEGRPGAAPVPDDAGIPLPRVPPLRASLTTFVGREQEVRDLRKLLGSARLVTLVGAGGAGKTRLAGEVAAELADSTPDGVWLVELAPLTDPASIPQAVLGALHMRERNLLEGASAVAGTNPQARLVDTLLDRKALLLLDNCEHVIDAVARLADHLLTHCPDLRILATSREPLAILGESLWPVRPLELPEPGCTAPEALQFPAVRLFADRAVLVRPGFEVTEANVDAVVEICRRLDGLPLALELAAARLRSLSVEAVAGRLGDRFRLLAGGSRTAVSRHQTLRAVVAWSWDLLDDAERRLAQRMAVFAGGATVEDAEAVCAAEDLAAADVLDLLTALTDKSLLVAVDDVEPRYRMLETIREFSLERLADSDDLLRRRQAHARHFLAVAETAEPLLRGHEQLKWLDRLTGERDNLLAALRFAIESRDADTATRLGAALSWYWVILGSHDEAATWLEQVLSLPAEGVARDVRAVVSVVHGINAAASGQVPPGPELAQRLRDQVRDVDLTHGHPLLSLIEPGIALLMHDDELAAEAVDQALQHSDPWVQAMLHMMRGAIAENSGDVDSMRVHIPAAIAGFRTLGDRWGLATSLTAYASLEQLDGDAQRSITTLEEARRLMRELRASDDEAYALLRLGLARLRVGDIDGAWREVRRARQLAEDSSSAQSIAFAEYATGELERAGGHVSAARAAMEAAHARMDQASGAAPQVMAIISVGLAHLELIEGRQDRAVSLLRRGLEAAQRSHDMPISAVVAIGIAGLALDRGRPDHAAELIGTATRLRGADEHGHPDITRLVEAAQTALGDDAYDAAYRRGRSRNREDALALLSMRLEEGQEAG